jgi:formylglycine-generating enzyme required for sulfatase activity
VSTIKTLAKDDYWPHSKDREEALKDDFPLEGSAYDDEDEEDEWAGDDTAWNEETEVEDETDGRDESSAYLEFLNEEASTHSLRCWSIINFARLKNSKIWKIMIPMTSSVRRASSRRHSTRSSLTNSFETPS